MTTEAIRLIHELSTPARALTYLEEHGQAISDDALEHILDLHLKCNPQAIQHLRASDWLWLYTELSHLLRCWTEELPVDIAEHRLIRISQEEKAQKIILLRKIKSVITERIPNH